MSNYLDHVGDLRRRLNAAERQRAKAFAELMAFLDTVTESDFERAAHARPTAGKPAAPVGRIWEKILETLASYQRFRATDVVRQAEQLWSADKIARKQTHGGARAQLSLLARKGIFKRLGGGNYCLTNGAKVRFGYGKKDLG